MSLQMQLVCIVFATAALQPGTAAVAGDHPIGGVISLLQKLMIQAKQEGETEAANFQKFTYWCKRSTRKLKRAVKMETRDIERFEDQIEGLKKDISTLTEDIESLTVQIESQEAAGAKAAKKRQNETEFYEVTYKNLDDTIVAVDDAVEVMEESKEASDAEMEAESKNAINAKRFLLIGLKDKVEKIHAAQPKEWPAKTDDAEARLDKELASIDSTTEARAAKSGQVNEQSLVKSVTALTASEQKLTKTGQLPDEFADINLNPGAKNPFKKGKVKVFTEHEGEVIETFRDVEGDLEFDKLDVHQREANAQNAYELAKKARDFAISAAKDNKKEKEDIKAAKTSELVKAESDHASESKERDGDTATLESTDQECKDVNEGWDQRSAIRAGEIEAMEMAVKILEKVTGVRNPDTHEIPKKALAQMHGRKGKKELSDYVSETVIEGDIKVAAPSFLQVLSQSDSPKDKAVALLRQAAEATHSGALKKLAAQIQAFAGPFDKIKQMIQKMTFQLQAEQKDEDDHKNWCDLELQQNEDKHEDLDEKVTMLKAELEELDSSLKITVKGIAENEDKLADLQTYMEEETELRQENKAEIKLTIKDAEDGAEAVAQAIAVLKDFYKKSGQVAKEPWEFLQVAQTGVKLPEKPSTWDASYTGVTDPESGSDGVLGILEGVATKFAAMESDAKMQDTTDQKAYDKDMASKKVEIAEVTTDTQMKEQKKSGLQEKLDAAAVTLKGKSKEDYAVVQYLKDLQPACAPGEGSYEDRKKARADEITALRKAQVILEDAFRAKA